jgi:hypothetical protein
MEQTIAIQTGQTRQRRAFAVRFAAAALAICLLSGCAVQICGDEFPYRTNSCPVDSLANPLNQAQMPS